MRIRGALPWLASLILHAGLLLPAGLFIAPAAARRPLPSLDITILAFRSGASRPEAAQGTQTAQAYVIPRPAATPAPAAATPAFRTVPRVTGVSSEVDSNSSTSGAQPSAVRQQTLAASGVPAIGWEGSPRAVVRRSNPRFPPVLSASGQEVEGEARITVAPSGAVVRVEITRGTGYIEVDESVAAALRDYLFSRVDGKGDALGTVRFRFRLEKMD